MIREKVGVTLIKEKAREVTLRWLEHNDGYRFAMTFCRRATSWNEVTTLNLPCLKFKGDMVYCKCF